MKKVNLSVTLRASMSEEDGKLMAEFNVGPIVHNGVPLDDAVKIEMSLKQALDDHMTRLNALGAAHASGKA